MAGVAAPGHRGRVTPARQAGTALTVRQRGHRHLVAIRASAPPSARSMAAMSTTGAAPLLTRIAAGQRASLALGRDLRAGNGFVVALAAGAAEGLSMAVPTGAEPADWRPALAAVRDAFDRSGATPRIEYVEELHPTLAPAAHAAGWRTTALARVMALAPHELVAAPSPGGAMMRFMRADDTVTLEAFLRGQHRAFGGDGESGALAWLPILRLGLREGAMDAVALERNGHVVAGASLVRGAGVSELAGVWTLPDVRRQGFARAACSALLAHGFAAGDSLAWLSTEPAAAGLYRSLGFRAAGTQRNVEYRR